MDGGGVAGGEETREKRKEVREGRGIQIASWGMVEFFLGWLVFGMIQFGKQDCGSKQRPSCRRHGADNRYST